MRADIVSGALFPDYELSDHTGQLDVLLISVRQVLIDRLAHDAERGAAIRGGGRRGDLKVEGAVTQRDSARPGFRKLKR